MTEPNIYVAQRVVKRVAMMNLDATTKEVMAVYRGEDIGDPYKTVAIRRELEEYGFPLERPA